MILAVFYDLTTRDGRQAIEVRRAIDVGGYIYASTKATMYSVAYRTQAERQCAFKRVANFVGTNPSRFEDGDGQMAAWQ